MTKVTEPDRLASCAALVERGDPDRFAATMAAPAAARARLWPLYAFNLEVARAPWVTKEPLIAEMRLQWWRDVISAPSSGAALAHEVAGPLHDLIRDAKLPVEVLDRLIAARRRDIEPDPFSGMADLSDYLEQTGAGLMWLAAKALGAPDDAEPVARHFGWASGLAGYLRAVPELVARGRVPLPGDAEGLIRELAETGMQKLALARASRSFIPAQAAPALFAGWQAEALLRMAAKDPSAVSEGGLQQSEFGRRWGLVWRALSGRW